MDIRFDFNLSLFDGGNNEEERNESRIALVGERLYPTKKNKIHSFTAVDFETMTPARTSACSIGMVRVIDGKIEKTFYSLIKPIPDKHKGTNSFINGITKEMVIDAPTFKDLWPQISEMLDGVPFVCHNYGMDIHVFEQCCNYYNIEIAPYQFVDTYWFAHTKLVTACKQFGITTDNHHNALADSEMTAMLFIEIQKYSEKELDDLFWNNEQIDQKPKEKHKKILGAKTDNEIDDSSTILYGANVVISGVFSNISRDEVAIIAQRFGAKTCSGVSKKTKFLICGDEAGPAKISKVQQLQSEGYDIRVMDEQEFITITSL